MCLISAQKHRLWVLVGTASAMRFKRVPTIYVFSRNMKNIRIFYLKIFIFFVCVCVWGGGGGVGGEVG